MVLRNLILGLLCFVISGTLYAQMEQPIEWARELAAIEKSPSGLEQRKTELLVVRKRVEDWINLHPGQTADLPTAQEGTWTEEQFRTQISALKQAIENLLKHSSSGAFDLGVMVVNVTATAKPLSPVSESMDRTDIRNRDALTVNRAIEYLPGVSVDNKAPRNQSGISIAGFDTRQVPLYLDGTPVYVPFDGYVDLTRYLTSDIGEIQVAKGYSSALLGPNTMGGVINLVTRAPQKRIEVDSFVGSGSGDLLNTGLHLGSRWRQFYFQGSADRLQSHYFPLSGAFVPTRIQANDRRANSYQRDERYNGRAGWNPRGQDSYVFSYTNQKGRTGDPAYSGRAPSCPQGNATVTFPCVTPKYWKWPYWNSESYYFNSNTKVGEIGSFQFRGFHSRYPNSLQMYDDETYATMNRNANSGILKYDDRSTGASGQFETRTLQKNTIGASFFVKHDTHREQTTTFSTSNIQTTSPRQADRDEQLSFGIQDIVSILPQVRATFGLSADHLNGLEAQDLNTARTQVVPFQVSGVCSATNTTWFTSCTSHFWVYNPLASITYTPGESGTVFVTFAQKSRFPTLRDRYSYKAGRALPNPALLPERASNWSVGYSRALGRRTVGQIDLFHNSVRDAIGNIFFASPLCSGGGRGAGCQQAINVSRETFEGVNVIVRSTPFPRLTVDANYSFLNRTISSTTTSFPTGTPKHKAVGTAIVRLPRAATGIVSLMYQSGIVAMSDNNLPLPVAKFAAVDLGGTLPIRAGISLQLGLKNLLDRNYYYWEGFPQAGRNWYATLRYAF